MAGHIVQRELCLFKSLYVHLNVQMSTSLMLLQWCYHSSKYGPWHHVKVRESCTESHSSLFLFVLFLCLPESDPPCSPKWHFCIWSNQTVPLRWQEKSLCVLSVDHAQAGRLHVGTHAPCVVLSCCDLVYEQKALIGLSCAPVTVVCVTPQMKVVCSVNYSSFCSLCVRVQRREMNVHILTFNIIWGRKYFLNFSGKISTFLCRVSSEAEENNWKK